MSPPAASLRARREARQPWIEAHGHPRSESIDVPSVTPETEQPANGSERLAVHALQRLAHAPRPAQRQKRHAPRLARAVCRTAYNAGAAVPRKARWSAGPTP